MTDFSEVGFADVDAMEWATAVGHSFIEIARWDLTIEKCWIADDLSLLFIYQFYGSALGGRFADLHNCRMTGHPLKRPHRKPAAISAGSYAMGLFYGGPVAFGMPEIKWTAPEGRRWWGEVPEQGWSVAVTGPRLVSIR